MEKGRGRALLLWFMVGAVVVSAAGCGSGASVSVTPSPIMDTPMPFGRVIADGVPVRSGPGKEFGALGTCGRGDMVSILGVEGSWYRVQLTQFSDEVWIFSKFFEESSEPFSPTSTATSRPEETLPVQPPATEILESTRMPEMTLPLSPAPTCTPRPIMTPTATLPQLPTATWTPQPTGVTPSLPLPPTATATLPPPPTPTPTPLPHRPTPIPEPHRPTPTPLPDRPTPTSVMSRNLNHRGMGPETRREIASFDGNGMFLCAAVTPRENRVWAVVGVGKEISA